ncbi:hypothetical protein AVL50_07450 [Flammeovirga sp. SJP92]|nr:hypothetical protein AVL50_07450 [Flammeovirga sp. SJP92]
MTMTSCFEEEVTTEGCVISPEFANIETTYAAEIATLENDNATCEEKKVAGETLLTFIEENEECIYDAIDFYAESEEEAEELKAELEVQLPLLKLLATVPCQ